MQKNHKDIHITVKSGYMRLKPMFCCIPKDVPCLKSLTSFKCSPDVMQSAF